MDMPPASDLPPANPYDNQGPLIVRISAAMIVLSGLAVILRFVSRRITQAPCSWDDWLVMAALPFAWCTAAFDIWGLSAPMFSGSKQLLTRCSGSRGRFRPTCHPSNADEHLALLSSDVWIANLLSHQHCSHQIFHPVLLCTHLQAGDLVPLDVDWYRHHHRSLVDCFGRFRLCYRGGDRS